jgi:polysaccharide export outer membrane protein
MKRTFIFNICLWVLVMGFVSSCTVSQKSVYFNDLPQQERFEWPAAEFTEPTIKPDDILSIQIQTVDPTSASSVNQGTPMQLIGASSAGGSMGNQQVSGFLVDRNGMVTIPMLGEIKVGGLTTTEAKQTITASAKRFYQDPTVQVRFANYKVSVHGEVARPGVYTVQNEKVTLLDALALAGDLTIYGKRENVLLIRDIDGKKEYIRFNLNSATIFESPYFYLRQNDVIYVEPGKGRTASADSPRWQFYSMIASFVSIAILAISRF